MDDLQPANMPTTTSSDNSSSDYSSGVTIPVTIKKEPAKPTGVPAVPLETVEPPMAASVPPPAPVDPIGPAESESSIPPAPLDTLANAQPDAPSNAAATDVPAMAPSGKSLKELLAEEEAKHPQQDELSMHQHKNKGKGVMVMVAVLLALALIGGAAFAYMQTNKKVQPAAAPAASTPTTPATTTSKVKGADIDKTTADIDTSLKKVDDTKDYNTNDLSDTTLGL